MDQDSRPLGIEDKVYLSRNDKLLKNKTNNQQQQWGNICRDMEFLHQLETYGKQLLDTASVTGLDALKAAFKNVVNEAAEAAN